MRANASSRALLSILLLATGAWIVPTPGIGQEVPNGRDAVVAVENRSTADARVYVVKAGHMVPLGLVEASESDSLPLPEYFAEAGGQIELIADLVGTSRWFEGDPVTVEPSSTVRLTIEPDAVRSTVVAR